MSTPPPTPRQQKHARFWRKFLRLTRGRVAVLRALDVLAQEEDDDEFRGVVRELHDTMQQGATLHEAVETKPHVFSLSVRELIRTAEKSGAWDEILYEVAAGLEEGSFD